MLGPARRSGRYGCQLWHHFGPRSSFITGFVGYGALSATISPQSRLRARFEKRFLPPQPRFSRALRRASTRGTRFCVRSPFLGKTRPCAPHLYPSVNCETLDSLVITRAGRWGPGLIKESRSVVGGSRRFGRRFSPCRANSDGSTSNS